MTSLHLRSLWIAIGYALVALIIFLSLTPRPPTLDIEQGDKLGHLLAYGTLMFWFCQLYATRRSRIAHALAFAAMGVALEFAQRATGYRSFEYLDMLANATGVALGWAAVRLTGGETLRRLEGALLP